MFYASVELEKENPKEFINRVWNKLNVFKESALANLEQTEGHPEVDEEYLDDDRK